MSVIDLFANNAATTLGAAVSTTPAAGTSETWTVASTGGPLPQIVAGQQYRVTVGPASDNNPEIVWVTAALSGTTVTVLRGMEGSAVKTHALGDLFTHTVTAGTLGARYLGPTSRRPLWRVPSYVQIFQTGHGWTTSGSGVGSSTLNDTSTFIKGTQCATIVTAGNGGPANLRSTAVPTQDLTHKAIRLTFKIDNVTNLNNMLLYVGSSAFANFFLWQFHTHAAGAQNIVQSGEWVTLTVPWANVQSASGTYTLSATGVPSITSGFTCIQVGCSDNAAGPVTFHLQAVEVVPDTVVTFPTGVVSVTFDDSYQNVYDNARPIMDSLGYRGTLCTIASAVGASGSLSMIELKNLQTISGWEVAGHAFTTAAHNAGYDTLTALQVNDEMRLLRAWMLANGFPLDDFAYPLGHFGNTSDGVPIDQICGQYFSTARTILSDTHETFAPAMPYRLRAKTGISSSGTAVSVITAAGGSLDRCQLNGSWYIICLHQVTTGTVTDNTMISQTDFNTLMNAISTRGIPVLPVSEVIRGYT